MSDIRFNRWLHQSGTGGVYQDGNGRVGIGTSVPTSALDVQSGTIKIGSNTLSSTGVSTFTTVNATSISATNLVVSSGSTSAPSISPTGDSNTGIFFPSADTVAIGEGGVEALRVNSSGNVGIGTANPTSHLSVRGTIESLADTNDLNSSTEGGQLILRAPINQAGTKYRYNIDNYYGTSGGQPSSVSNFRIFREDDSTTANGTVLFNIDQLGRVVAPSQPSGAWTLSVNASSVRSVSIKKNIGSHVSSVPGGNGSTHGSVGRFTAPVNGAYLITLFAAAVGPSSQCLMSLYGSWTSATNTIAVGTEVFDCRSTKPPEDGGGWSQIFYFSANDYWEIDWYRPSPTSYIDTSMTMNVTVHLLG